MVILPCRFARRQQVRREVVGEAAECLENDELRHDDADRDDPDDDDHGSSSTRRGLEVQRVADGVVAFDGDDRHCQHRNGHHHALCSCHAHYATLSSSPHSTAFKNITQHINSVCGPEVHDIASLLQLVISTFIQLLDAHSSHIYLAVLFRLNCYSHLFTDIVMQSSILL